MSKEKTIKVGKIIIEIGNRETPLTIEEAKALKAALCELFPEPKQIEHHHTREVIRDTYRPYWQWNYGLGFSSSGNASDFLDKAKYSLSTALETGNDLKLSYCANSEPSL